jgi:hypothetical protein
MRLRNSVLTESGLLSARDTEAVETPARAATARIPCFDDRLECGSTSLAQSVAVTLHAEDEDDHGICPERNGYKDGK